MRKAIRIYWTGFPMGLTVSLLRPSRPGSQTAAVKGGSQGCLRVQLPSTSSLPPCPPAPPQEPTSPRGPRGHQTQEAFLLEDDAAADEEAGQEGQTQADVEAVVLREPLMPAVRGDIAGRLGVEVTDDLAQDLLGGAV